MSRFGKRAGASDKPADEKLDMGKLMPVFIIVLVDLLGLTIIIPLMPLYAASFGANAFIIGLLAATYPIMQIIGAPILGRLSDRYGRKPVLVFSQIGTFAGFMLMGFANALPLLFLARIIDGLSGANIATAQAVITDNTNEKTRTSGLALIGAAFGLGFTIGPVIAFVSLGLSGNNYQVPAFVAAGFSLLSLLLTTFWLKESLPAERRGLVKHTGALSVNRFASALRHPVIGFLLILMFVQQFVFGGMEQILSLFSLNRLGLDARSNSIVFLFIGVITVVMLGSVIRTWSKKHGDRWIITVGLVTLAFGLLMVAFTPAVPPPWYSQQTVMSELQRSAASQVNVQIPADGNNGWIGFAWLMLAMIPVSIGGSVLSPTINSAITKRIDHSEVGGMLGTSAALVSAANALAPVAMGALYQVVGAGAPFLLGGVILLVMLFFASRQIKEAPAAVATPA
jgi:DHA1 family tetracycline resistance protein-like MFS transporter